VVFLFEKIRKRRRCLFVAREKICGIYKITNNINDRIYVGSSFDIKERWHRHKTDLRTNKHGNNYLQNSWNKYGECNFIFSMIESFKFTTKEYLLNREQYWIDFLNVCDRKVGYNLYLIAGSALGYKKPDEEKERMRSLSKSKPILQIDTNGNLVKRWYGVSEISKKLGFSASAIKDAVKMLRGYLAYGFIWVYEKEYDVKTFSVNYYLNNKNQTKRIVQLDMDGNLINTWESLVDVINKNKNYKMSSLSNLCNKTTVSHKSYKGFIWMYEYEYLKNGCKKYFKLYGGKKQVVIQMDKDLNIIKIWDSMANAANYFNTSPTNISDCAKGRTKTSNGFRWIKKSDYDKGILTKYIQKESKYKKIIQLELDNNYIFEWNNSREIERKLGFSHSLIQNCCKGKYKTAYKFKWMYKEDYEQWFDKITS